MSTPYEPVPHGSERTIVTASGVSPHAVIGDSGAPVPVLAVGGEHNVGTRSAEALCAIAPHVCAAVIKDKGHLVRRTPEDFAQELIDFLV